MLDAGSLLRRMRHPQESCVVSGCASSNTQPSVVAEPPSTCKRHRTHLSHMQAIRSTVCLIQLLTFILQLPTSFNGYFRQKLPKVGVPLWEHANTSQSKTLLSHSTTQDSIIRSLYTQRVGRLTSFTFHGRSAAYFRQPFALNNCFLHSYPSTFLVVDP